MKKIIMHIALIIGLTLSSHASIRSNFLILDSVNSVRIHANNLATNYLIYTRYTYKREHLTVVQKDLEALTKDIQEISLINQDKKTKEILTFFAYQRALIEKILQKKPNNQSAKKILDITESILKGSDDIVHRHPYDFDEEEKMFMITRRAAAEIENLAKYYLAVQLKQTDKKLSEKIDTIRKKVAKNLSRIRGYTYRDPLSVQNRKNLMKIWNTLDFFLEKTKKKTDLPLLVSSGVSHMNGLLKELSIYHSKNQ